jgi:GntR family transcriptional repressor for pyruvate dehydrogenase complex
MSSQRVVEPIQRSRLYHQVVVSVCQLIRQGQLKPGQRLPAERELAEQLQVGRSSLREALRALEISGIVESRQGGGTYVRDFFDGGVISPLALILEASDDIIGDLWEVRIMIEPSIAARAAVRVTDDEAREIHALVKRQADLFDCNQEFLETDREFHVAIARASRNDVAVRVVQLMKQMLQESRRHFATSRDRREQALHRHQQICAAIQARDARAAREAMLHHLQDVEAHILGGIVEDSVRLLPD